MTLFQDHHLTHWLAPLIWWAPCWIGGPADSPGAGAAQAAREVKQQTQSAGSQVGQGAGGAMRAPNIGGDSSAGNLSNTQGITDAAEKRKEEVNADSKGQQ